MSRLPGIVALLLVSLIGFSGSVAAHTRSETHSAWQIEGMTIHLTFTVPELEAKRLASSTADGPSGKEIGDYLASHVAANAAGAACPMSDGPRLLTAVPGYWRFEFVFACSGDKAIQLVDTAFFELVPTHVNFAEIQTSDGEMIEQLFTSDRQSLDVSSSDTGNKLRNAGFFDYVLMGIMHIFTGIDHQSFLLGLVLISRRLRDLVFVVTGFTLGHSATLALAVTGIIRPHAEFIDALIGLTIVLIGTENFGDMTHRPEVMAVSICVMLAGMALGKVLGLGGLPAMLLLGAGIFSANYLMITGHLRDAARFRLIVTLVFGLIHGFGFASDLLEMKLPTGRLAELLVGFNLGVEIGQLTLVALVTGVAVAAVRLRVAIPRPIMVDVGSAGLVAIGLFWFVGRSYG